MSLADRDYTRKDHMPTRTKRYKPIARKPKLRITQTYYNLKQWFFRRKHPYSKLRLDKLQTNLAMVIGLAIILLIVRSYSDILDSMAIWFLELGTIISIILLYFIIKNLYKVFVNLRYGFRGSTNGFKLISIVLLILLSWQIYQIQDDFSSFDASFADNYFNILIKEPSSKAIKGFFPDIKPVSERTEEAERLIFDKTNAERKACGLHELTWDSNLANTAREHSVDMAQNGFFSHVNLKGEGPTDRARRNGLVMGIGENIGKMPTGNIAGIGYISHNPDSVSTAQVQSWMESPGHRSNMLYPQYTQLGVGVSYDGMYYVSTQNFQ
jgi:uncharacterized protein YkwD